MHRVFSTMLLSAGLATGAGGRNPPPPRDSLSDRIATELRARLPQYEPAAATPAVTPEEPVDPDVILLPEMRVREKRLSPTHPDDWLQPKALRQKMKSDYLASMDGLTGLLNSWSIPFLTPSVAARAGARYRALRQKSEVERLVNLAAGVDQIDPKAARELRDEITNMVTGRPPARR